MALTYSGLPGEIRLGLHGLAHLFIFAAAPPWTTKVPPVFMDKAASSFPEDGVITP